MSLAPAGDFASFCQAAYVADIKSAEIDPVVFQGFAKLPLGGVLLTHRDRCGNVLPQASDGRCVFTSDRVFDEVWKKRFKLSAQRDCVRRVEPGMNVDDDFCFRAKFIANGFDQGDSFTHGS